MVIYIFYYTSRKVFIVLISRTEVENQFIKGFKGLKTDWWGKYTSGILIETIIMSMELFTVILYHILHDWMEEYSYWLFPWLCGKALHTTICLQSLFIFCEPERSILFIFLLVWSWNDYLLQVTPIFFNVYILVDRIVFCFDLEIGKLVESRNLVLCDQECIY